MPPPPDSLVAALARAVTGRLGHALGPRLARRLDALLAEASDLVWTLDARGRITYASPAAGRLAGLDPAVMRGLPLASLLPAEHRQTFEQLLRHVVGGDAGDRWTCQVPSARGETFEFEFVIRDARHDAAVRGLVVTGRDVTERNVVAARLRFEALHDPLTGLPNRALLVERVNAALIAADGRRRQSFAVAYLDLDGFKAVNDVLGHSAGDTLLKLVADRIIQTLRIPEPGRPTGPIRGPRRGPPADTLARVGGDEFVALLHHVDHPAGALRAAERVQAALSDPFEIGGRDVHVAASVGVSIGPGAYTAADDMVRDADIAMYRAKRSGDGRVRLFDQPMHEAMAARLRLENDLRAAIERDQFTLHFQPIFPAGRRGVQGFEALVRWQHPERGLLTPDEFLASAEDTRLILPLGRWILREACRQLRRWLDAVPSLPANVLSVNLSALEILQPDAIASLQQVLADTGVPPRLLRLELTESLAVRDPDVAIAFCRAVRALGMSVGVDDFGAGHCSLSHLRRLGVDYVKVDRTLLDEAVQDAAARGILRATAMVAEALDLDVVFQGIERREHLVMVAGFPRSFLQGYLLSRPVPEVDTWRWLRTPPAGEEVQHGHR